MEEKLYSQMSIQGMKLFQKMTQDKEMNSDNVLFSPYSLFLCLVMAAAGAKGRTQEELIRLTGLSAEDFIDVLKSLQHSLTSQLGSAIHQFRAAYFVDGMEVKASYQELLQVFEADFQQLDFSDSLSIVKRINTQIEKHTNGMLKNVLPADVINRNTRMVLLDTLFFQGKWKIPFQPENTSIESFFVSYDSTADVPMMWMKKRIPYFQSNDIHGIVMPYKDSDCEMIAIMPVSEKKTAQDVINLLAEVNLENWLASATDKKRTEITFPRFTLESKAGDLVPMLQSLDVHTPFSVNADFSGITEQIPFLINQILQAVKIEIDECGTKAAAATIADVQILGIPRPEDLNFFHADRPFVVLIYNKTLHTILFACKIANPCPDAEIRKYDVDPQFTEPPEADSQGKSSRRKTFLHRLSDLWK